MSTAGNNLEPAQNDGFYEAAPVEPLLLYQGEILVDVPLLLVSKEKRWLILRTNSGKTIHEALKGGGIGGTVKVLDSNQTTLKWNTAIDGDSVVSYLTKRPVLVLSQTCDIQNKDFIQVAPIYPADPDYVERLKRGNEILSAFYLEAYSPHFGDSYADFERIQAVHKTYIKRLNHEQHLRLNGKHVRNLQSALTRYFGRPNTYDARADKAPQTGTYLCADCFYFDGVATPVAFDEGDFFRRCEVCEGEQWVRKGP